MPHYFVKPENIDDGKFILFGEEAHHLINVLRVKKGEEINLFDGSSKTYTGKIESITKTEIKGSIIKNAAGNTSKIVINLYSAVAKGDRFEWLLEKAGELGVKKVVPLICERSVAKEISDSKYVRWRKISLSASEQSNRATIMEISPALKFIEAINSLPEGSISIIPWEAEGVKTIKGVLNPSNLPKEINILIGPEGGFTQKEIEWAHAKNVIPVTLGAAILRVETAGILASILVLNLAGEYGA